MWGLCEDGIFLLMSKIQRGKFMAKYILNIKSGKIHNGESPCHHIKRAKKDSKKEFDTYEEALNYFEGNKKGEPCNWCLKDKE